MVTHNPSYVIVQIQFFSVRLLGERQLFLRSSRREKLEEVIWRKVFYDVIQTCKQHRQVGFTHWPCILQPVQFALYAFAVVVVLSSIPISDSSHILTP